jgi:hypothetical protein
MNKPSLKPGVCLLLCILLLFYESSCKRDLVDPQNKTYTEKNRAGRLTAAAPSPATRFGIFYNTGGGKSAAGIALDVQYERTSLCLSQYKGIYDPMVWLQDSGFNVLVNVNYYPLTPATGFITNLSLYKNTLNSFIAQYRPAVAVIENEEDNSLYHTGTASAYINELSQAVTLCHAKNIPVTNGGLTTRRLTFLVYEYYLQENQPDSAASFAARAIPPVEMRSLNNRSNAKLNSEIVFDSTLVVAYKNIPLDYVNIHYYEPVLYVDSKSNIDSSLSNAINQPTPGVLQEIVNYLEKATGKTVMTNEIGQINSSPSLVTGMLQNTLTAQLPYAIWYDATAGGNNGAIGLSNGTGTLMPNGIAFLNFMQSQ